MSSEELKGAAEFHRKSSHWYYKNIHLCVFKSKNKAGNLLYFYSCKNAIKVQKQIMNWSP